MRISDWSSDVCSSDLHQALNQTTPTRAKTSPRIAMNQVLQPVAHLPFLAHGGVDERIVAPVAVQSLRRRNECKVVAAKRAAVRAWFPYIQLRQIGRASCRESVCQYV